MPVSHDPTKRSRVNTRARLLEAAFEVFAERGFAAATVEEICDAAGFSRGAFYSSFSSKEELFFALWEGAAAAILDDLGAMAGELADAPESVDATIERMVRRVTGDRRWFLVSTEFTLHAIRHPDVADTLAQHRVAFRRGVERIIAVLGATGPDGVDIDVGWHARMLVAAVDGVQHQLWVEPATLGDGGLPIAMVRLLLGRPAA